MSRTDWSWPRLPKHVAVNTKYVNTTNVVVIGGLLKHGLCYHSGMFVLSEWNVCVITVECLEW